MWILKVDIPFFPGLFVAGRFDRIYFPEFNNPMTVSGKEKWDTDYDRYTGVIGYKASKEVLIKTIGFIQKAKSGNVIPKDDGAALQVSISF